MRSNLSFHFNLDALNFDVQKTKLTKFINNRVSNGSATALTNSDYEAMYPNSYHASDDIIYFKPTSFIVPKGSPLQVCKINRTL